MKKYNDLYKLILILSFSTIISLVLRNLDFHESNFILIYVLGVLFISKYSEKYIYGVISCFLSVILFNFFFTEPYFSLRTYRKDYPLTFLVMLFASIITSMQTIKLKKEIKKTNEREKSIKLLYEFSKEIISIGNRKDLVDFASRQIGTFIKKSCIVILANNLKEVDEEKIFSYDFTDNIEIFNIESERKKIEKLLIKSKYDKKDFLNYPVEYFPIYKEEECVGIIGILNVENKEITNEEKVFFDSIIILLSIAIEKEILYEKQRNTKIEFEKEKMKSNLLRSISHDLRTPLASIIGSTTAILDNSLLSEKVKIELLTNILDDANWLLNVLENILNMTRIEEGKLILNKSLELVSDLVSEIATRTNKIIKNHIFVVEINCEDMFINLDPYLFIQLVNNLIDNAIKYTPEKTIIQLIIYKDEENIYFEVRDNGLGIKLEDINNIFERFYRGKENSKADNRGLGLGLSICKSIAIAHGWKLEVYNNNSSGATFKLSIKIGEINGFKNININS